MMLLRKSVALLSLLIVLLVSGCGGGGGPSVAPLSDFGINDVGSGGSPSGGGSNGGSASSVPASLNPVSPPAAPSSPPPLIGSTLLGRTAGPRDVSVTINLPQGYSLVSFPFAQVTSVSGLTRRLYAYANGDFQSIDPVHTPSSVDPRIAYIAYADNAQTVTVTGVANSGSVSSLALVQGWNLVGCPSQSAIPFSRASFTRDGLTRVVEEATSISLSPSDVWLTQQGYTFSSSDFNFVDLQGGGGFQPRGGLWVFAWQEVSLNFNPIVPGAPPQITSLSTNLVSPGDALTINGSGFTSPESGLVVNVGGRPATGLVTVTGSTKITLEVPGAAASGSVVVYVNGYPSNRASIIVNGGGSGDVGTLYGQVQNGSGTPLQGCQITLDTGQSDVSDSSGSFRIDNIPAGEHAVFATLLGYRTATGLVTILAGQQRSALVTLSAGSGGGGGGGGGGGTTTGNLYVVAKATFGGYYPIRVQANEYGAYGTRWDTSTLSDSFRSELQLTCSGATVGKDYTIRVTWSNGSSQTATTYYRNFGTSGETETIDTLY